jgi:hypothetical protein
VHDITTLCDRTNADARGTKQESSTDAAVRKKLAGMVVTDKPIKLRIPGREMRRRSIEAMAFARVVIVQPTIDLVDLFKTFTKGA